MPKLVYQSGRLEVDMTRRELRVREVAVPIGGRAFEIIEVLAQAAGSVVSKDDLMERVWPGAIVEESTLWVHISAVRKALGAERGRLKTISRRGYQLLGHWRVVREAEPIDWLGPHPAETAETPTFANNLPAAGTNLIGREQVARELQDRLSAYRVVTLTGPGGIGKSRLALETARRALTQGHGHVWLVELASLSDQRLIPSVIASTLSLRTGMANLSPEVVARAIGQRTLLLLLDNCEHVVDAAALFAEAVVRMCPHVTILVTSREILRIDGECVYNVPPLDIPDELDTPGSTLSSSAVQLFIARIVAVDSAFSPDDATLREVANICQRLDGIPLAIEFAAARAAALGVSVVNSYLDDRFNLLTAGRRTTLARHQTLRATLDWSFDLLTEVEQICLCRLSVAAGPIDLDMVVALVGTAENGASAVNIFDSLVGKSLIASEWKGEKSRYRFLETTRAYALLKLKVNGTYESAARRHAEYILKLLKEASASWQAQETWQIRHIDAWVEKYGSQIDNVRAALDWAFGDGKAADIGPALAVAAIPLLWQLSLYDELAARFTEAVRVLDSSENLESGQKVRLLDALGMALVFTTGPSPEAVGALNRALSHAERAANVDDLVIALRGGITAMLATSRLDEARGLARRFREVASIENADVNLAIVDRWDGLLSLAAGDLVDARASFERVLKKLTSMPLDSAITGEWVGLRLGARIGLCQVLWLQGLPDEAVNLARECVEDAARSRPINLLYALLQAGCQMSFFLGDLAAAGRYVPWLLRESSIFFRGIWLIWAHCFEAELMIKQGSLEEGIASLRRSIDRLKESHWRVEYTRFSSELARALGLAGRATEGLRIVDQAIEHCENSGERWALPEVLRIKAGLVSDTEERERLLRKGIELAQHQHALSWELRLTTSLARDLRCRSKKEQALRELQNVYAKFSQGFSSADLVEARNLIAALGAVEGPGADAVSDPARTSMP
jgi:predicted ATPase/DNA-binding winged helix-turn-helix (wHTH) protein